MERYAIPDREWSIICRYLILAGVSNTKNLRRNFEGILYRIRTGTPWRDLPPCYGKWCTVYKRFLEWAKNGKLKEVFNLISSDQRISGSVSIDGSSVKCHQHSSGARRGK